MSSSSSIFEDTFATLNMSGPGKTDQFFNNKYFYPGGDATSSTRVFLSLYEEEEACEEPGWLGDDQIRGIYPPEICSGTEVIHHRPTIYFVSRLFDSIKGFHKVSMVHRLQTSLNCLCRRAILICLGVILK